MFKAKATHAQNHRVAIVDGCRRWVRVSFNNPNLAFLNEKFLESSPIATDKIVSFKCCDAEYIPMEHQLLSLIKGVLLSLQGKNIKPAPYRWKCYICTYVIK